MAKDPAFLFYPGDYLRDTQCLSEKAQVAYDRILCEHMRNICITQAQLDFFTKRLSEDEKKEITMVVQPTAGGFHIPWVTESITKRREYSDSRRKNRGGSKVKKPKVTSSTYDSHMDNEDEIEIEDWIKWGELIVADNDQHWHGMKGRKVSKKEMDEFLSVATRNEWEMKSQQAFRISLNGFSSNGKNGTEIRNRSKLH